VKYFRFSVDYILWELSFINLSMLGATVPMYEPDDENEEKIEYEEVQDLSTLGEFLKLPKK
jgi:hypothetical protein